MGIRLSLRREVLFFSIPFLVGLQGCIATRNWVNEQVTPLSGRLSESEGRLNQSEGRLKDSEGRVAQSEGRITQVEGRVVQVDAKAERALNSLANLRMERKLVLDLKEGAHFGFNSIALKDATRKEIDGFLSDMKGDLKEGESAIFLVAGHTDGIGSEEYNYELGRRRADSVARYLITQKKVDPTRVVTVSYGKGAPLADNGTKQGREKNRRVEIMVYREDIVTPASAAAKAPQERDDSDQRISRRTTEGSR
ncbi:MAG: OmpA family protein [Deltaproteobacteria bacterium]|nr:OmpA family protein [Deltaproteobacteria bacterium]